MKAKLRELYPLCKDQVLPSRFLVGKWAGGTAGLQQSAELQKLLKSFKFLIDRIHFTSNTGTTLSVLATIPMGQNNDSTLVSDLDLKGKEKEIVNSIEDWGAAPALSPREVQQQLPQTIPSVEASSDVIVVDNPEDFWTSSVPTRPLSSDAQKQLDKLNDLLKEGTNLTPTTPLSTLLPLICRLNFRIHSRTRVCKTKRRDIRTGCLIIFDEYFPEFVFFRI